MMLAEEGGEEAMPRWEIIGQFTVEAATPDEAVA